MRCCINSLSYREFCVFGVGVISTGGDAFGLLVNPFVEFCVRSTTRQLCGVGH